MTRKKHPDPKIYRRVYDTNGYIVFVNDKLRPFDEWTGDWELIVWDKTHTAVIGVGKYRPDGAIDGEATMGLGSMFRASDPKSLVREINACIGMMCK